MNIEQMNIELDAINAGFAGIIDDAQGATVAAHVASSTVDEVAALVLQGYKELEELEAPAKKWTLEKDRAVSNGVKRPSVNTTCATVWDAIEAAGGKLTAQQQRDLAASSGINPFTIRTQYALCRKFHAVM